MGALLGAAGRWGLAGTIVWTASMSVALSAPTSRAPTPPCSHGQQRAARPPDAPAGRLGVPLRALQLRSPGVVPALLGEEEGCPYTRVPLGICIVSVPRGVRRVPVPVSSVWCLGGSGCHGVAKSLPLSPCMTWLPTPLRNGVLTGLPLRSKMCFEPNNTLIRWKAKH